MEFWLTIWEGSRREPIRRRKIDTESLTVAACEARSCWRRGAIFWPTLPINSLQAPQTQGHFDSKGLWVVGRELKLPPSPQRYGRIVTYICRGSTETESLRDFDTVRLCHCGWHSMRLTQHNAAHSFDSVNGKRRDWQSGSLRDKSGRYWHSHSEPNSKHWFTTSFLHSRLLWQSVNPPWLCR